MEQKYLAGFGFIKINQSTWIKTTVTNMCTLILTILIFGYLFAERKKIIEFINKRLNGWK